MKEREINMKGFERVKKTGSYLNKRFCSEAIELQNINLSEIEAIFLKSYVFNHSKLNLCINNGDEDHLFRSFSIFASLIFFHR